MLISISPLQFLQCFCITATNQERGAREALGTRLILIGVVFTDLCRDLQKTIASQPAAAPPRQPEYQQPKGVQKEGGREEEREEGGRGRKERREGKGGKKERGSMSYHGLLGLVKYPLLPTCRTST